MKKTFIIEYTVYNILAIPIKKGTIKVKNKMSSFEAQCSLEEHFKKTIKYFERLEVHDCKEDLEDFDISHLFKRFFGGL